MQLSIDTLSLTGEIAAEGVQGLRIVPTSEIQDSKGIGAEDIEQFPRGNKKLTITFTVQRAQDSGEEGAYF